MPWHVALISAPLMGMKLENALYSAENAYFFRLIPPYLRYNSQDCNLDNFIYGDRPKIVLPSRIGNVRCPLRQHGSTMICHKAKSNLADIWRIFGLQSGLNKANLGVN
jgi:hypothetical protein